MTGQQPEVPIGMQRLSCLPCRKRKSKCDRTEPCSSCVLRNTERFCYTGEVMEEDTNGKSNQTRKEEKGNHARSANNALPPSQRPNKIRKKTENETEAKSTTTNYGNNKSSTSSSSRNKEQDFDRSSILTAIQSVKATLSGLEAQLGRTDLVDVVADRVNAFVRWDEIRAWLPPREEAESILDCYFVEVTWFLSAINSKMFMETWKDFADGKPVPRTFAALTLFVIGNTLCLAPASHPVSRLTYRKDHKLFMEHGYRVLLPSDSPFTIIPQGPDLVQAQLYLTFYLSHNGWPDSCDIEMGKLLRYSRAIHLFDEDKWNLPAMNDWEIELRRRMALDIEMLDRFLSVHFLRSPTLPQASNFQQGAYYTDESYHTKTGKLIEGSSEVLSSFPYHSRKSIISLCAHKTAIFLLNFLRLSPSERYQAARDLDLEIQLAEEKLLSGDLKYEDACNLSSMNSPGSIRRACQSLILYSSLKRQRCTITRQFLLDSEAPVELRVSALEHAKCIIEAVPIIIAVATSPYLAYSPSWTSGHLFCAASTFAIVYLGEEEQKETSAELDWFASKIFEVLDALSVLSFKDRVAQRCEELLIALCTSRDTLRAKFTASKTGKRQQVRLRERESMAKQREQFESSVNSEHSRKAHKETWPGFRSLMPEEGTGHIPPGAAHVADAPNRSPAYLRRYGTPSSTKSNSTPNTNFSAGRNNSQFANETINNSNAAFFSSPEQIPGQTNASGNYSSDSRNNSIAAEGTPESGEWWPALNDGQWNALINSLGGDWDSLAANNNNANLNFSTGQNPISSEAVQQNGIQPGNSDYFTSLHASMLPTMPI